ncbi:DUF6773 family protein [Anaerotignum sp. MB30-C6]|uniref:DUF6773 family protein n=1 Tax=Anaerotignum sp. MB30-C6 TaxID=3070814 RepID=UPI0027DD4A1E|nr:DUF6773 family protein [Anaerotignum sp. MB30-C6]WMI81208.1 hypothetical protein RBQ60_00315 [Anaerotignum sp. MB30-C6]
MARRKFEDERLENVKNKITTEWFIVVYYFGFISVIVKIFFLDIVDLNYLIMELFLLLLTPLYCYFRSRQLGVVFPEDKRCKKRIFTTIILIAVAWIALAAWIGGRDYAISWTASLLLYGYIAVAVGGIIIPLEKKRKKKLEEQWGETE